MRSSRTSCCLNPLRAQTFPATPSVNKRARTNGLSKKNIKSQSCGYKQKNACTSCNSYDASLHQNRYANQQKSGEGAKYLPCSPYVERRQIILNCVFSIFSPFIPEKSARSERSFHIITGQFSSKIRRIEIENIVVATHGFAVCHALVVHQKEIPSRGADFLV